MNAEEWRPVAGFEGRYEVSSLGRVRSWVPTTRGGPLPHMMRGGARTEGYATVILRRDGRKYARRIYRLVAEAFLGPAPFDGAEVRHLNGTKDDNSVANLAWGTRSQNMLDRVVHGQHHCANRTHCPQGHPYDEANTRVVKARGRGPFRACKTCENARRQQRRARQKAVA